MDFKKAAMYRQERNLFAKRTGVLVHEVKERYARLSLTVEKHHLNPNGVIQGGALMTLADSAMATACMYLEEKVATLNFYYDFMKSAKEGDEVVAIAHVLYEGGSTVVSEAVLEVGGEVIGRSSGTFFRLHVPLNLDEEDL